MANTILTEKATTKKIVKKECPPTCPKCREGDLGGGGPLACRYTCGHVIKKADLP